MGYVACRDGHPEGLSRKTADFARDPDVDS
jgi:hypothetical protein